MGAANTEKGFEGGTEPKIFIYFYHPDHASASLSTSFGTNTFLTDMEGQPYQLFINLSFAYRSNETESNRIGKANLCKPSTNKANSSCGCCMYEPAEELLKWVQS